MMRQTETLDKRHPDYQRCLRDKLSHATVCDMPPLLQPGDLLTSNEAAEPLRVTVKTLERWEGRQASFRNRLPGGHKRYRGLI